MKLQEMQTREAELNDRLNELADIPDGEITEEQREEFDAAVEERDGLAGRIAEEREWVAKRDAERARAAKAAEAADVEAVDGAFRAVSEFNINTQNHQNPWERQAVYGASPEDLAARAFSAVERIDTSDAVKEALTRVLETGEGQIPDVVLATTSPEYRSEWQKYLRSGHMDDTAEAVRFADPLRRAMSAGTANAGGYLVPTDIEPSVTLSADGTDAPVYGAARKVQTTATTYRDVSSPNATWSWDGENTEVSDDTTTLVNTDIPLYVAQGFVPMSIASTQALDAMGIARQVLSGGYMDLIGAATTTGTGSSQPTGIVTALTGSSNEISSAGSDTYAVADVYSVHKAIAKRHRNRATWMGGISTIDDTRQFATDDGHALLARLADGTPGTLLGRPLVENPDMDDTINAAADNRILVFGDFNHFVVAEAIGTLAEVIPHVMGSNGRPTGARGLFMMTRFGCDSVLDSAFAMLNVT